MALPEATGKLRNVEAGRGIAASLVVLYHATKYYFGTPKYWSGDALGQFFLFGHAGVEFFFVLSGFIMFMVHRKDVGQPRRVGSFAWKRFQRIYPFFWLVLAVTLALVWKFPAIGQPFYRDPAIILQSFLLAGQDPMHAVVFVSWTLWHEMVFYAFCALVIAWPRVGAPAFGIWVLACAALQFVTIQLPWPWYLTAFINILFAFGVVVALLLSRARIPRPALVTVAGVALFLGTGVAVDLAPVPEWLTRVLFGLGGALALAGGVELERSGRWTAPAWLVALGGASFSIYLTHILTLTFLAKAARFLRLTTFVPSPLAFPMLAGSAILAGVGIHYAAEKPLLRATAAIKRAATSRRAQPRAPDMLEPSAGGD